MSFSPHWDVLTSLSLVVARMALLVGVLSGMGPHPYHMEKNTKAGWGIQGTV